MLPNEIDGIIFDLDGTLVDSRLDFVAMRRETGCPEGLGLLEFMDELDTQEQRENVLSIIHAHEMAGAGAACWMPGAAELLALLQKSGVPTGIVTRNSRQATEFTLQRLSAPSIDLITREDAPPKPDPAGLLEIAGGWGIAPSRLAYVGDFVFDLQAANNAGMISILYSQPKNLDYGHQADVVIEHFDQLTNYFCR